MNMITFWFRPHDEIDKRINYLEEKFGNCITLVDEQSRIKSSIEITGPLVEIIKDRQIFWFQQVWFSKREKLLEVVFPNMEDDPTAIPLSWE